MSGARFPAAGPESPDESLARALKGGAMRSRLLGACCALAFALAGLAHTARAREAAGATLDGPGLARDVHVLTSQLRAVGFRLVILARRTLAVPHLDGRLTVRDVVERLADGNALEITWLRVPPSPPNCRTKRHPSCHNNFQ